MESFIGKVQQVAGKVGQNRILTTISHSLMSLMPALIIGSIGSLLQQIPFEGYQAFMASTGLIDVTRAMVNVTTNMLALYTTFAIAYTYVTDEQKDGFSAGIISLISFLLVTPMETVGEGFDAVTNLPLTWLGSTGIFTAMVVAFVSAILYCLFVEKNITIKMPDSVPSFVSKSFAAIIPAACITLLFAVVGALMKLTPFETLHAVIYGFIAAPLSNMGSTVWAAMLARLLTGLCWFCGVHGMAVAVATYPVWMANDAANMAAISAGGAPQYVVTNNWCDAVANIGGAGCTLGLVILCLFMAKSQHYKQLGRLAIAPSIFGINEPVVFGFPMMFNAVTAIPFVFLPVLLTGVSYALVAMGVLPCGNGVGAPAAIPVLMGFINMGWRGAVWNVIEVVITIVAYLPFFKVLDQQALEEERGVSTAD